MRKEVLAVVQTDDGAEDLTVGDVNKLIAKTVDQVVDKKIAASEDRMEQRITAVESKLDKSVDDLMRVMLEVKEQTKPAHQPAAFQRRQPAERDTCNRCGERGHWASQCQSESTRTAPRQPQSMRGGRAAVNNTEVEACCLNCTWEWCRKKRHDY